MSQKEKFTPHDLLKICLEIDQSMMAMYRHLSTVTADSAEKTFWDDVVRDELSHMRFWESALNLKCPDDYFGNVEEIARKHRHLYSMHHRLSRMYREFHDYGVPEHELLLAYTGEMFLFDPLFINILHGFSFLSKKICQEYGAHSMKFVHAMHRFGKQEKTAEIEIAGEVLKNLYDLNLQLFKESITDPLTGLLNRRGFFQAAIPFLALSTRADLYSAVLILDLDYFKSVNDTHGHSAGDEVLRNVSNLIASGVRSSDLIGRYGGEEFIILCNAVHQASLASLCERLRKRIESNSGDQTGIPVTVSIGASIGKIDESGLSGLVNLADTKLYEAKKYGRNCYKAGMFPSELI